MADYDDERDLEYRNRRGIKVKQLMKLLENAAPDAVIQFGDGMRDHGKLTEAKLDVSWDHKAIVVLK